MNALEWSRLYFRNPDRELAETGTTMGALYTYADNQTLRCWPSQQTLAEITGLSVNTIGRHLKKNVDAGWLVVESRGNSCNKSSRYRLAVPAGFVPPTRGSATPAGGGPTTDSGYVPTTGGGEATTGGEFTPPTGGVLTTQRTTQLSTHVPTTDGGYLTTQRIGRDEDPFGGSSNRGRDEDPFGGSSKDREGLPPPAGTTQGVPLPTTGGGYRHISGDDYTAAKRLVDAIRSEGSLRAEDWPDHLDAVCEEVMRLERRQAIPILEQLIRDEVIIHDIDWDTQTAGGHGGAEGRLVLGTRPLNPHPDTTR